MKTSRAIAKTALVCMEYGRKMLVDLGQCGCNPRCPKCGSVDIEVD